MKSEQQMNEEQKVQSNMTAQEEQINIADLLLILRNNWKWFAASIFVGIGFCLFKVYTEDI